MPDTTAYPRNDPNLIYGCMWLGGAWDKNDPDADDQRHAEIAIEAALQNGITRFDHADIYTRGKAERVFGQLLRQRPDLREKIWLQSKCGIRFADAEGPNRYDLSARWITQSVDSILERLNIDQLDCLLLHRPDPLMHPEEIANVFDALQNSGKVASFGVSNMHHYQITRLQQTIDQPLIANQLEISLQQHAWLDEGIYAGDPAAPSAAWSAGTLEYCEANNVEVQSWGCLARGLFTGKDVSGESSAVQATTRLVSELAHHYATSPEAIVLAWLMRYPINIVPVIGTTNPQRIEACAQAADLKLSREHWYALFETVRGKVIP